MSSSHAKFLQVVTRIKEKRITLNYTQAYIAGKLSISQNAYSKLEAGVTSFTVKRLYQIAEILEAEINDFIA